MSQVLGRVIGPDLDGPRGPDVAHRVRVPQDWIDNAAVVAIELPRNLHCAVCEGGGCDLCGRSGALSLRGRGDPAEIVEVTLPRRDPERSEQGAESGTSPNSRAFLIRIPEFGGLPPEGSDLPRGHLLLTVAPGETPDAGVRLVHPSSIEQVEPAPTPASPRRLSAQQRVLLAIALVIAWIAFLLYLRLSNSA